MPLVDLTIVEIEAVMESLSYSKDKIENFDYCYGHYNAKDFEFGRHYKQEFHNIVATITHKLKEAKKHGI